MFGKPIDLSRARILLSNDDGIEAPGLKLLYKIARQFCRDVWVVAPEQEQSGASHSLTIHRPLRVRRIGTRRYAVDGTPTDCVLLAVNLILRDKKPDLMLSGINAGGNMGEDVIYSGTIAAALEATLLRVPAIAFSLHSAAGTKFCWPTAAKFAPDLIRRLAKRGWPDNTLVSVNFPDLPPGKVKGIAVTAQGRRKIGDNLIERRDPRGRPYYWIGPMRDEERSRRGTDVHATVVDGKVSITPVFFDLTSRRVLNGLRKAFR
ncbi:MAG TPA: 5'/3'-nucleotidase SurE [Stellaceae bacterium]|nr:5'/3'-nucleotidase SurE [Stellaceae bacterium]